LPLSKGVEAVDAFKIPRTPPPSTSLYGLVVIDLVNFGADGDEDVTVVLVELEEEVYREGINNVRFVSVAEVLGSSGVTSKLPLIFFFFSISG